MATKIKNQSHPADRNHFSNITRFIRFTMVFSVFVIFGFEAATATLQVGPQSSRLTINRTLKGDRIAPAFSTHSIRLPEGRASRTPVELVDGCESLVSRFANAPLARIAGRCIS
jgi:hypothetical protein